MPKKYVCIYSYVPSYLCMYVYMYLCLFVCMYKVAYISMYKGHGGGGGLSLQSNFQKGGLDWQDLNF